MELYKNDFNYDLPEDRIALFPADKREQSKLLVYDGNTIHHNAFKDLANVLPADSLLVFNNSKVVQARMHFQKDSGAAIEIFLLGPENECIDYRLFFSSKSPVRCKCTIGNKKRWRENVALAQSTATIELKATLVDGKSSVVEFSWSGPETWGEIVQQFGDIPLPPYIKRRPVESDKERYQTVYSQEPGAVASPTAGLHFTPEIMDSLTKKGIKSDFITLHVGAGTFLPIKSEKVEHHKMHLEKLIFTRENIENLLKHPGRIIPVGTTSCRSLESLYWFGVQILTSDETVFYIDQTYPYKSHNNLPTRHLSLKAVANMMDRLGIKEINGQTSIFIHPDYSFKMTDALVTNFHQPGSTLILLVAALIGNKWKDVYREAIKNNYRFLSYGDSSILFT